MGVVIAPPPPPLLSPLPAIPQAPALALPPVLPKHQALLRFRQVPPKHLESPSRSATPTRARLTPFGLGLRRCMDPDGGVDQHSRSPRQDYEKKRTSSYRSAIINARVHFRKSLV